MRRGKIFRERQRQKVREGDGRQNMKTLIIPSWELWTLSDRTNLLHSFKFSNFADIFIFLYSTITIHSRPDPAVWSSQKIALFQRDRFCSDRKLSSSRWGWGWCGIQQSKIRSSSSTTSVAQQNNHVLYKVSSGHQ